MAKTCSLCKEAKPLEEFNVRRASKDGRAYKCRACDNASSARYRKLNPGANRQYFAQRPEYHREWRRRNPHKDKIYHRKKQYGLTEAQYQALVVEQDSKCAACGCVPRTQRYHDFHVDHCHETGIVRGLLCRYCNVALGNLFDDPERLRALLAYIEGHVNDCV